AGDRVGSNARSIFAGPAEALRLDIGAFWLRAHQRRITCAVGLAEGVATGDQRDCLLVIHGHAAERLADVARGGNRIRLAVRPFRIDIDQAHLAGAQIALQLAVAAIALVGQPLAFRSPVDVLLGLPDVRTAAPETEGLEAHRLQRDVARENDQVGPGDLPAI